MAPVERDIVLHSGDAALADSLILPETTGPHPAVVCLHGSGQELRDGNRSVADHFVKRGIASLIYDKRGCGESEGDWLTLLDLEYSFPLLARDATAGLRFLQGQTEITPGHVGFYGLSQGGWIGPLAASQTPDTAFVISISGPGVGAQEQMDFVIRNRLKADGRKAAEIEQALSTWTQALALFRRVAATGDGWDQLKELLSDPSAKWLSFVSPFSLADVDNLESNLHPFLEVLRRDPEYRYDPVPALENLACPVLAIWGEADQLVPVERSLAVFQEALERSENTDFTLRVFPGADHRLRLPDGSMAPGYLEAMADWLRQRVGADRGNGS